VPSQGDFRHSDRDNSVKTGGHRFDGKIRVIEAKGVHYLIEAMPQILAHRPARLLIVGDGPSRAALERRIRELDLQNHCHFVGSVSHTSIYDYFSVADVFVGPSIDIPGEWTEAQGNTFVEALFARVPVVASRVGGIPDAIIHERTGLLVDERAPDQIARSVLRILSDARLAGTLKEAGYNHAEQNFSRIQSAHKLDAIYRCVLARSS
jgi:phosphatidyl-myo-inositol dimannoside synthase